MTIPECFFATKKLLFQKKKKKKTHISKTEEKGRGKKIIHHHLPRRERPKSMRAVLLAENLVSGLPGVAAGVLPNNLLLPMVVAAEALRGVVSIRLE